MSARLLLTCIIFCVPVALTGFACTPHAHAQNPFDPDGSGGGGSPFGDTSPFDAAPGSTDAAMDFGSTDATTTPGATSNAEPDADPIVRLVRESPPSNPAEMAEALTWLTRIKRWDEIGRQLDTVASWSLTQKASLARAAGSGLWIRLRSDEVQLSDAQNSTLLEILRAPSTLARDPQWIQNWITKLGSESAGERKFAQFRLQDAGRAGIQTLVNQILDGSTSADPARLAQTVTLFGEEGAQALRTACNVQNPERASRVLSALADLPGNAFAAQLGAALASADLPADTRATLESKLAERYGEIPDAEEIGSFLTREFESRLNEYTLARLEGSDLLVDVWQFTSNGNSIESQESPVDHLALLRLTNVAMMLLQQETMTRNERVLATSALLQQSYQVRPNLSAGAQDSQVAAALGEVAQDPAFWETVYSEATDRQLHGAALRAIQMIGLNVPVSAAPYNFLSKVLKDSRPVLRFTALETIAKFDPQQPYLGSDLALRTALEMSRMSNGPQVLVIGLQAQIRQAAQQQLRQILDANVTSVHSARAALAQLQTETPFEMVFIVDQVSDQSLIELIQRLRSTKRASAIPIAVLIEELTTSEQRLIGRTPGMVTSVLSRNADHLGRVVDRMNKLLDTQALNIADRAFYSITAKRFLSKISNDNYGFYHIGDYREDLLRITQDMSADNQTELLIGLGSSQSQVQLFEMAANLDLSEAKRLEATKAFAASIHKFGMLLNRTQVQACYDEYNRLGPSDPVSVRALGGILDVIESRAGLK